MPATIIPTKVGLTPQDREELEKLYGSPGYSLLKRILACHCIIEQIGFSDTGLYPENVIATGMSQAHQGEAKHLNWMLDKLDDLERKPDEWFTLTLEHRR